MKIFLCLTVFVASAVLVAQDCQGAPAPPPFTNEKADRESLDVNEVGPAEEDWKLYTRLTKTMSHDPSDADKTRELLKEIEAYSRLVTPADALTTTNVPADGTTDLPDSADSADVTETDQASSDWFASTWRNMNRNDDDGDDGPRMGRQDDGNVEDIIRKISNDLKKLYVKIKQVITVVKNWVNHAKGSTNEFDGYPMSASASESDGVFVIPDTLIGDIDKSTKYILPINDD
ncbi:uncharacterized protein LOC100160576 precursor [Acyrthosiphon pisum]|uniref:ACYPI001863 protein n=1 Tax=Acyrthosiphon pisum TaxID=7029 RepID=C4WUA8_ACYPI|nr:uncharacterized protein LOC100160576 precursor [Acyrthosiphon pisum]BAH71478.1 ACYPI001863 [Acyrthosiphon pisum]|eukprot:NP_001155446.1 uncharacterized protein LOC100160576 precursor [Acyrthosiphon pisum]